MSILKHTYKLPIEGEHVVSMVHFSPEEQERVCNLIGDALKKYGELHLGYDTARAAVIGFLLGENMELSSDNFNRWVSHVSNRIAE
jgi:hypothetical protein